MSNHAPITVTLEPEYPYNVIVYTQQLKEGVLDRTILSEERVWATSGNAAKQVAMLKAAKDDGFPTTLQRVRFAVSDYTVTTGDCCAS